MRKEYTNQTVWSDDDDDYNDDDYITVGKNT